MFQYSHSSSFFFILHFLVSLRCVVRIKWCGKTTHTHTHPHTHTSTWRFSLQINCLYYFSTIYIFLFGSCLYFSLEEIVMFSFSISQWNGLTVNMSLCRTNSCRIVTKFTCCVRLSMHKCGARLKNRRLNVSHGRMEDEHIDRCSHFDQQRSFWIVSHSIWANT